MGEATKCCLYYVAGFNDIITLFVPVIHSTLFALKVVNWQNKMAARVAVQLISGGHTPWNLDRCTAPVF